MVEWNVKGIGIDNIFLTVISYLGANLGLVGWFWKECKKCKCLCAL